MFIYALVSQLSLFELKTLHDGNSPQLSEAQVSMSMFLMGFFRTLRAEAPLEFTIPLRQITCMEGETVEMVCEVSEDNQPATWLINGKEISPSDDISIKVDGKRHVLTIHHARPDDQAVYTVKIGDKESSADLTVKGKPVTVAMVTNL